MPRMSLAVVTAFFLAFVSTSATAQPVCKPRLAFTKVNFSGIKAQQRTWTATLAVDASRCATTAGHFEIGFDRIIEYGPDLRFFEPFEWKEEAAEISYVFGYDEAPTAYWISVIAPCPCRN